MWIQLLLDSLTVSAAVPSAGISISKKNFSKLGFGNINSWMIWVSFSNGRSSGDVVFLLGKILSSISVFDVGSLTPFISGNFTSVLRNIYQAVVVHDGFLH